MPDAMIFTPPGVSPDEGGRRARQIARRLEAGEALPGHVLASFEKTGGKFPILSSGPISARGSHHYPPFKTGMAHCFIVGDPAVCMIGQTLAAPQPISQMAAEVVLSPFTVKPDPEGLDS